MPEITIRPLDGDAETWTCAEIMAASDPWLRYARTRQTNHATLTAPGGETYGAVAQDGGVVGVVALALRVPLIRGYILGLAVAPEFRNRGIGTQLLRFAEQRIFRESPNVFMCVSS